LKVGIESAAGPSGLPAQVQLGRAFCDGQIDGHLAT
jgi:hypothetical protein